MNRFVTVFHDFDDVHFYKDVGCIPALYSRLKFGHTSIIVYRRRNVPLIVPTELAGDVTLVGLDAGSTPAFYAKALKYLWHNKEVKIVNLYHLTLAHLLFFELLKLIRPDVTRYLKLDMDQRVIENATRRPHGLRALKLKVSLFMAKRLDVISAETSNVFEHLRTYVSALHRNLLFLPNGIWAEHTASVPKVEQREKIILCVGRIGAKQKNNELAVEALCKLERLDGWRLVLAGPVEPHFQELIAGLRKKRPALASAIELTGPLDKPHVYGLYARASVFCLTSRWEGFPLVLPEAAYFGNYIVTTDIGGAREITENGRLGTIVRDGSVSGLSNAFQAIIDGKIDIESMRAEQQAFCASRMTWEYLVPILQRRIQSHANGECAAFDGRAAGS
jgi:glycosyltransferase involved in cell wall biosynthesis